MSTPDTPDTPVDPALEFHMERTVRAPRALVWRAWTEPELLTAWWGPRMLSHCDCALDVRVGGAYSVTMHMPDGARYPIRGQYLDVVPLQRLVMTQDCSDHPAAWHDMIRPNRAPGDNNAPGIMRLTVTLEDDGSDTRMTLRTHFDSAAVRDAMVSLGMSHGWSESVEKLNERVTGLSGLSARHILMSRVVKAPQALVWAAMTEPTQLAKWWGPTGFSTHVDVFDFRVGGFWTHTMVGPDGTRYPNKSRFREIRAPERIGYTLAGGREHGKGTHFEATWTFEPVGDDATLVTGHLVFPTAEDRDFVAREYGAVEGGRQTLARLAALVEGA